VAKNHTQRREAAYGLDASQEPGFCHVLIRSILRARKTHRYTDETCVALVTKEDKARSRRGSPCVHRLFVETLGAGTRMKSGEDTEFTYRVLRQRLKCVYAPEALIHHDNWLSLTQYQTLARDYLLSGSAALTKFALRLDRTASVELARTAYYILLDKKGVGNLPVALGTFLIGCAKGVEYSLMPPPRLPATS